jgi:hypothetical protein
MKIFTSVKMLALVFGMMIFGGSYALAGDGTKSNPYTVAELNAQKDALASSGETVWVKADLKGLGEDGTKTDNATGEDNVKQMAGLFGDATGTFVAYSWQILGELELSDLTNTKDLLISLTYGTEGHPYGNSSNPQYASKYEPADAHFSLGEVHGALSLQIKNGYRGYHIASSYVVPKDIVAARVSSNYTGSKGATIAYGYYDGAEEGKTYIINKNTALVLLAYDGTYDFVLSSGYYEQINSNSLNGGEKAGVNTIPMKNNALRYHYRFVANSEKVGFERNCEESTDVNLESKDEVYLTINGNDNHFFGNWTWETTDKKWISWTDKSISDFHEQKVQTTEAIFDFTGASIREKIGSSMTDVDGFIYNETFTAKGATMQLTAGSAPSRIYTDSNRGQCLVTYKEYTTLTFNAPADYAITQIVFTAAGNSNINNFAASSGAINGMIWTGNAEGVRFAQGGTSYLANAIVTLAAKDGSTTALPAIEYKECANIAAFNALSAGDYAKVTLTDAEVIGKSADGYSTVWIQDATGGCWIQYTTLNDKLAEKTKVNGVVYVAARPNSRNVQMKEAEATLQSEIISTAISDYTIVEGTIAEVNVEANLNKVVKITGATLEETSATAGTLTQGDVTIAVNNGTATANQQLHKIAEWAKDTKLENVTIVAILVGKSTTENQLLPISITTAGTGIANVNATNTDNVEIYNLQGVRLNQLQRGINIVSGKKVFVK